MYGTILAGTDGSPTAAEAVARAAGLAAASGGTLLIVSAYRPVDQSRLAAERALGRLIDGLAPRFRVTAFDPRGAGRSGRPDRPYSIEMMAGDAAAVMDRAGVGAAHVLGVSMGGRIALALALAQPARVTSLVLTSTSARS